MWVLSQSLFFEGYLLFLILKFIWKCVTCFPCCSLIVLSFGQEKKYDFMPHLNLLKSLMLNELYESLRDEIWPFLSTLSHICVFCFFFLDTLSLVTPLSLLISLSFLKPLSIVFQNEILSVCFNVVVCARIERRKKKKKEFKERKKKIQRKKKKKKKKKESFKKKKIKRVVFGFTYNIRENLKSIC